MVRLGAPNGGREEVSMTGLSGTAKVAIISIQGTSNVGGVERVAARQEACLRKNNLVRIVALPTTGLVGRLRKRSRVVEHFLMALFPLVSPAIARCWAGRRGIVVSHGYSSIGIGCDAVFAHGCWAEYVRNSRVSPGPFSRLIMLYETAAARWARKVVSVSESVASQWIANYGLREKKSEILLNTVDVSEFSPIDASGVVCQGSKTHVLFVGRLEYRKGIDYLEILHREIARESQGRKVSVTICSPSVPSETDRRRFPLFEIRTGLEPRELVIEYNRADLFILPSRYEAFELSSLEALACGTPVLLNDTGSRPTLERLGCPALFRLESAPSPLEAIHQAVLEFRGLSRSTIANWTAKHFSEERLADQLESIFKTRK